MITTINDFNLDIESDLYEIRHKHLMDYGREPEAFILGIFEYISLCAAISKKMTYVYALREYKPPLYKPFEYMGVPIRLCSSNSFLGIEIKTTDVFRFYRPLK